MKRLLLILIAATLTLNASAGIIFEESGTSANGVDVTFQARLTIIDDALTIELTNASDSSLNPDDLLGSFYFDIVDSAGDRPDLAYLTATGNTYEGIKNGPDNPLETDADIQALVAGDGGWQFKTFDGLSNPFLGFGIGTVGNSGLVPSNFDGNIVEGINYAIYTGEITTQSLTNPDCLVKDTATFTFSGLTGFTEDDIAPDFAFGLGTAPDSLLVPEPTALVLLGLGGFVLRKRK